MRIYTDARAVSQQGRASYKGKASEWHGTKQVLCKSIHVPLILSYGIYYHHQRYLAEMISTSSIFVQLQTSD